MADPKDISAAKMLRSELGKRMVDVSQADVRVMHGVAYIKGVVKPMRGGPQDVKAQMETVAKAIRQKGLVKDVVLDCSYRT